MQLSGRVKEQWKRSGRDYFSLTAGDKKNIRATLTFSGVSIRFGEQTFSLHSGAFESGELPPDTNGFWGPVPLVRLPTGVSHTFSFADHR